jgi:16S rRNA (uracil1498-N3)-methyltransferase
MRRFYAPPDSFIDNRVVLGTDETRHLRDVLRLGKGDKISVFNGTGGEFQCRVEEIGKRSTIATVENSVEPLAPESPLDLTLAAALLKGDKFDLVVQKAVELGVKRLIPLETVRCDVKTPTTSRMERWRRISLEATKQSGRAAVMQLAETVTVSDLIAASQRENVVLFSERNGVSLTAIPPTSTLIAIVGPEGGWDDSEILSAENAGVKIVTFGGRILRAETAAIACSAILQNRFGDLN